MSFVRRGNAVINNDRSGIDAAKKRRDSVREAKKKEDLLDELVSRLENAEVKILELQEQINHIIKDMKR